MKVKSEDENSKKELKHIAIILWYIGFWNKKNLKMRFWHPFFPVLILLGVMLILFQSIIDIPKDFYTWIRKGLFWNLRDIYYTVKENTVKW